ncbi:MAG: hypothetical protein HYR91_12125 [Flavobacteriia bacterium]|nr:hypothetical protein [Flavobacteriia bacterium]
MPDLFELDYFSIIDISWAILALVIFMLIVNIQKKKHRELDYAEYYTINIWMKIILGLVYAIYYITVVKGGDTLAYWDGAIKMNHLFWKNPNLYFEELFNDPDLTLMYKHFDTQTGIPPGWIYRESESWFISKVLSLFTFISFKSYLVTTIILAYISSLASWKLFELLHSYNLHTNKNIAIATILIPSVSFWCSGINKDTIVLFSTIFIIYHAFHILSLEKTNTWKNWIYLFFFMFLLFQIRSFMVTTILVPMILSYSVRLVKKYKKKRFKFYLVRGSSFLIGILFFVFQGSSLTNSEKLEEAAIINKDFATNELYQGTRYDIGITDYSAQGMLAVFPSAVIAGLYRPYIWEALNMTMIANGIEDLFFLFLTVLFLKNHLIHKINIIRKHEFLVFSFFFMILMSYMSGVTSGLLGVLVRFKAPTIPFLILILTININKNQTITKENIINK